MKNYLMKQAKKSLSLALAVLMLMSCWVWVAPEKAEAAAPNSYTVTVEYWVNSGTGDKRPAEMRLEAWTRSGNGTSSTETHSSQSKFTSLVDENNTGTFSATYDGWPSRIYIEAFEEHWLSCTFDVDIKSIKINDTTVWKGNVGLTRGSGSGGIGANWYPNTQNDANADGKNGSVSGGGDHSGFEWSWPRPTLESASVSLSPTSHTLARINSGTNSTSTITLSGHKDQYGVNWTGPLTNTFDLRTDGGVNVGSSASSSGSGNSRTIKITPWFQTYFPAKQNAKLYIDWTTAGGSGKKTGTETITVDFPTYMATFHANGGKIGDDESSAKDSIEYTGEKMNIGSVIGKAPAYAAKTGFEFKGFYSKPNADATGKTASFSGTLFEDDVTTIPAATSGNGDTNWYAAWQALPITATFLTQDGQLIGTVEGRYNNYMTASNMYNGDAGLNAAVKASHTAGKVKFNTNNEPIYTDGATSYTFAGWKIIKAYDESVMDKNEDTVLKGDVTFQATYTKTSAEKYSVYFEDGNGNRYTVKDKNGVTVGEDYYNYRADVIVPENIPTKTTDDKYEYQFIGWAKDIGKNFYTVDANDQDENGATIAYTHKDGASFVVKGDASYVPVFRMVPREYKVTYNYKVDGGAETSTEIDGHHWDDNPRMPEIKDNYTSGGYRYFLTGWKVNNAGSVKQLSEIKVEGDMSITAVYGRSEAAKYTINFYGKDETGEADVLLNADSNIYEHNSNVTAPEVPQTIVTADALYTFAGWSPAINTTASGDANYYATYTKQTYADVHFYNYDGTLIYEIAGDKDNGNFIGETIPAYTGEIPVKESDPIGSYTFTGWADSQGNKVVPGTDKFTGDVFLTAQFETEFAEYTVEFVNEGATVSKEKYHYGDEITVPADPTKKDDVEYIYDFRAWSPEVSEVCYGNATYTATYRRTPQYYTVTWLDDAKKVLTESNYKYNQKIQQATINDPVSYPTAEEGKTWAFKHWVQCDQNGDDILVDGKQVLFVRGDRMPAKHLYFYPVFEEVDNVLTVKFYKEDGTSYIGEAKIPYGSSIDDYDEAFKAKAPKASDATYHYVINNWINVNGGADVTTVTADVSVKATYTAEKHNKQLYEVVAEPTANVPGYGHFKCEADECTSIDYNVAIAPIADEGAPTGHLYVGDTKWTSEDYNKIDYTDIKFVGSKTQLIISAKDTGSVSEPWNADGKISRGVGKIEYHVAEGQIDPTATADWTEIYNYEALRDEALNEVLKDKKITLVDYNGYIRGDAEAQMKKAEIDREVEVMLSAFNANATGVISNLNLENGKNYVIYIRISDREGNGEVNISYLSSGTISYGSKAPEISVSGEGYGTKFCAEATVAVTDDQDGVKVYLDGEEITALDEGKFTCGTKGLHNVTAIDKNGNKTVKTFEIKGNHSYRSYVIAASCENEGASYDLCTVCGSKANEKVIPAIGHSYTANYIDKAPDCINNGYRTYVCDNNCGTSLVLQFDKETNELDAAKVAQAKKWDAEANNGEGAWVALEKADLAHLKATGTHTYAMVKDENGEDTEEFAWVIDREATCKTDGLKHRDCIVCGISDARITVTFTAEEAGVADNGHKFYREKVTLEPTCTETGKKTKTCRYCGHVELVETLAALGHIEGDYRIIADATCEEDGSKILTCSRCSTDEKPVDIGEPIKDAEGNVTGFDGKAVEIPAIGHAYKARGDVFKGADGKWYQKYVCKNDETHTEDRVVEDYEPPVEATVTFKNGEADFATIPGFVGDTISASEISGIPEKEADATKTYTFSHWADAEGNAVKFPVEVNGDATYYAVFAERFVNYTITYYKEDGTTEFKKVGYNHNGDEVVLADGPSKAGDWEFSYKFAGWAMDVDKLDEDGNKVIDANGNPVKERKVIDGETVTINAADISLFATYNEIRNKYAVTYAYSKNDIIHTYMVYAGSPADDVTNDFEIETKAFDSKYHYEFKGWNKADQLKNVESDIYTTPEYDAVLHNYNHEGGKILKDENKATCTTKAIYTYTCTCGYSYEAEEGKALGHDWGAPEYDETTGKNIITCQRCDTTEEDTRSFTAKFFVEADDAKAIKTVSYIKWGTKISATSLPATPDKESTDTTDYEFAGWIVKGDTTETIVDFTELEIKQDYEFVAKFNETTREYSVVFAYDAKNVIKIFTEVKAGSSVTFDLTAEPTKAPDENYHYEFSNWEGYTAKDGLNVVVKNVQKDVYILAEFSKTKHSYDIESELGVATCTNGKGTRYSCVCGKYYDVTGKPLDHEFEEVERKEATPNSDGYIKYDCKNCDATKEDVLKYADNTIEVKVYAERNGSPAPGIKVEIRSLTTGEAVYSTTNANGIALFRVDKNDTYQCYANETFVGLTPAANGNLEGFYSFTEQVACTCACHRDNIWGAIFRFFHKIIKIFTGEFKCCANPDPLYG